MHFARKNLCRNAYKNRKVNYYIKTIKQIQLLRIIQISSLPHYIIKMSITTHNKNYPFSFSAAIINSHRVPITGASALISI